jgi:hypothetical protein
VEAADPKAAGVTRTVAVAPMNRVAVARHGQNDAAGRGCSHRGAAVTALREIHSGLPTVAAVRAQVPVKEGSAVFVEAGADHGFTWYERLSVLVIFERKPAENP